MNHFTRTAFLKVNHPVKILNKFEEEIAGEFDVCGPCCTPFDVIACGVELPKPEEGDVIGIFNAGAYGYTMSMLKFLSFGYPQEIIVDNGKPYLISDETQP